MPIRITSPAFEPDGSIPARHTCDGDDLSPALEWSGVPAEAHSLALIMHDPDAPGGDYVHWVLFDLPPTTTSLTEGADVPAGARGGVNDYGNHIYGGPCPPPGGPHRYIFRLFALDQPVGLEAGATRTDVLEAIEGHVLAQGELTGRYQR